MTDQRVTSTVTLLPARPAGFGRLRPAPLRLDWAVAAVLAVAAEVQVWLGGIAAHERLVPAVVGVAVTASVAIRRRYPASVGVAAAALLAVELGIWGDAQVIATSIAYLCALYGLTVWTPPRRVAVRAALILIGHPAAGAEL